MLTQIKGLHHVTSMAADAQANNDFFTKTLGIRRVKKTVNFDAPDVYHLYYGDELGTPGSVMTYFPFPHIGMGRRGAGEVAETVFSVPEGSLGFWQERLATLGVTGLQAEESFGEPRLRFLGPDGDGFALTEARGDSRPAFAGGPVAADEGVRGFHGATLRLRDGGATGELLRFMGYQAVRAAMAPMSLTLKCCPVRPRPSRARDRCITSPLPWRTVQRNSRCGKRCWRPATM